MKFVVIFKLFVAFFNFAQSFDVNYFDDNVLFRITTSNRDVLENKLGTRENQELIPIVSNDDERYYCLMPEIVTKEKDTISDYTGPTPSELLISIYNEQFCSLRIETFWSYELCHGRYLRQYHQDKDAKITAEYYLGNFPKDKNKATPEFDFKKPPVKDIDGKLVAYFPVNYIHGTHCDLSGQPRNTTILYICAQDQLRSFISITEVKSCVYEAVVAVKELCNHPAFKKEEPIEHDIQCFASEPMENPVPKSMLRFQNEIKARPMLPLKSNQGPLTQRVPAQYAKKEVYDLFKNPNNLKELKELKRLIDSVKKPPKPAQNQNDFLEKFWNAEACLTGGATYWKYEFCFNHKVSQFHDNPNGETARINLGYYIPKLHKQWAKEPGNEARRIVNGKVQQISIMFSNGDLCPEANTMRRCEVRMKCRPKVDGDLEPNLVDMFLVEPSQCNYVLLVESSLLCDKMQTADEFGLMPMLKIKKDGDENDGPNFE